MDPEPDRANGKDGPLDSAAPMPGVAVTAPDGGWGWVVLAATIIVLALTLAFPSCVGIFYTDLQKEFSATNSETSWVPSIMTSVLHAGGIILCVLFNHHYPLSLLYYHATLPFIIMCNIT